MPDFLSIKYKNHFGLPNEININIEHIVAYCANSCEITLSNRVYFLDNHQTITISQTEMETLVKKLKTD